MSEQKTTYNRGAISQGGPRFRDEAQDYDAVLLVSFGGPEGMEDVMPFLENVLRGRNVPHERMIEVSHHYEQFDGVSPINSQNRALIEAMRADFAAHGLDLPIYFGNRNWHPMLADTIEQMKKDGVKRAICFFTSMFSCYSGCRQYRENIFDAVEIVGEGAPEFEKVRMGYNHPGFINANVDHLQSALDTFDESERDSVRVVFTAHSIPLVMAKHSDYEVQLEEASRLVAEAAGVKHWDLVYQSRSGPPQVPWLEPDVCDHLEALHEKGNDNVIILPIGFVSDHMEVMFDLDTEATELAQELGMKMVRAASVGTHPYFVSMIRELIVERMAEKPERPALGTRGPNHDVCPVTCCLPR